MDGAPPGTIFAFNPESGYINKELFVVWLNHFISTVKPSPTRRILLFLDGHTSHTKNVEALDLAREHGVIMLVLPAHTTHRLQPLDVAFFKHLSSYYIDEMEVWLRANPGRVVTQFQISQLFGKAYGRSATVGIAVKGFAHTGVWPVDRNVFQEEHFAAVTAVVPASLSDDQPSPNENGNQDVGQQEEATGTGYIPVSEISPFLRLAPAPLLQEDVGLNRLSLLPLRLIERGWQREERNRKSLHQREIDCNLKNLNL
mgnify:CR=1 FL=1